MAFPTFVNSATTVGGTNSSAVAVTMPASIAAGRLLLTFITTVLGTTVSATGWTSIGRFSASSYVLSVFGKIAAGSDTMSINKGGFTTAVAVVTCQIDTWSGVLADISFGGVASTDPPALTPAAGAKNYLWFAALASNSATSATVAPTNYSNLVGAANGYAMSTASRQLNATSEDPGVFTGGGTTTPSAATLSIAPSLDTALPRPLRVMSQAVTRASTY